MPPLQKPNEETNCIHVNSDHPPSIVKEISRSIEKRLSILSSAKNIFQESAIYYEKYLKNSGYKSKLQYQQPKENNQNKRKEKVTLFGSIHHTASPLKAISGEYSSN